MRVDAVFLGVCVCTAVAASALVLQVYVERGIPSMSVFSGDAKVVGAVAGQYLRTGRLWLTAREVPWLFEWSNEGSNVRVREFTPRHEMMVATGQLVPVVPYGLAPLAQGNGSDENVLDRRYQSTFGGAASLLSVLFAPLRLDSSSAEAHVPDGVDSYGEDENFVFKEMAPSALLHSTSECASYIAAMAGGDSRNVFIPVAFNMSTAVGATTFATMILSRAGTEGWPTASLLGYTLACGIWAALVAGFGSWLWSGLSRALWQQTVGCTLLAFGHVFASVCVCIGGYPASVKGSGKSNVTQGGSETVKPSGEVSFRGEPPSVLFKMIVPVCALLAATFYSLAAVARPPLAGGLVSFIVLVWLSAWGNRCLVSTLCGCVPAVLAIILIPGAASMQMGSVALAGKGVGSMFSLSQMPVALYGLLASPGRGLLTHTPVFLLAAPGLVRAFRSPRENPLYAMLGAQLLLQLLVAAAWADWWGGWCFGPRPLWDTAPTLVMLTVPTLHFIAVGDKQLGLRALWVVFAGVLVVFSVWVQWVGVEAYEPLAWNRLPQYEVLHTQCMPQTASGRCGMGSLEVWVGLKVAAHSQGYKALVNEGATLETASTSDIDSAEHRWRLWDWSAYPPAFLYKNFEVMSWRQQDEARYAAEDVDEQSML